MNFLGLVTTLKSILASGGAAESLRGLTRLQMQRLLEMKSNELVSLDPLDMTTMDGRLWEWRKARLELAIGSLQFAKTGDWPTITSSIQSAVLTVLVSECSHIKRVQVLSEVEAPTKDKFAALIGQSEPEVDNVLRELGLNSLVNLLTAIRRLKQQTSVNSSPEIERVRNASMQSSKAIKSTERKFRALMLERRRPTDAERQELGKLKAKYKAQMLDLRSLKTGPKAKEFIQQLHDQTLSSLPTLIDDAVARVQTRIQRPITDPIYRNAVLKLICAEEVELLMPHLIPLLTDFQRKKKLDFHIFPAGEWDCETIAGHLQKMGRMFDAADIRRLELISNDLRPDECVLSTSNDLGNGGYVVFRFHDSDLHIAENPEYGNATYLLTGAWDEVVQLLKLTKEQALRSPKVSRIIHKDSDSWIFALKARVRAAKRGI